MAEVVDRLPLDPKHSIIVLKIGASYYLVGMSESSMSMLSRLESEDVAAGLSGDSPSAPQMLSKLTGLLGKRAGKES